VLRRMQDEALLAIANGDWSRAANSYATLETMQPGVAAWPLKLGECLREAGNSDEAVGALSRAVRAFLAEDDTAQAIAICEQILAIDPYRPEISSLLGRLQDTFGATAATNPALPQPTPAAVGGAATRYSADFRLRDLISLAEDPLSGIASSEGSNGDDFPNEPPSKPSPPARREIPRVVLPFTPFFAALDKHQIRTVNVRARLREVGPGEILYAAGEPADVLYLVAAGEIAMLVPQQVARLQPGEFFGEEVAVLPQHARMSTMRAATPSQVLALDRNLLDDLVAGAPVLLEILSESLRERRVRMLAHTSPMLAALPEADRMELLARFRFRVVDKDGCICQPGVVSGLHILLAGDAEACFDDRLTERLRPGDVFGEVSLVTDHTASVRVTAREKCFVLCIPKVEFEDVQKRWPQVVDYLTALAEHRFARLQQAVFEDSPSFLSVPLPPRILVMGSDAETRLACERALGEAGFLVEATGDTFAAGEMIANRRYDVVLHKPDSFELAAGNDLLRSIRKCDLDVPIILVTRPGVVDSQNAMYRYSVVRSFVEPFDLADLVHTANRAVHFHRLTRVRREAMTRLNSSGEWMGDGTGLEFHFEQALGCLWMAFQPIVSAVDSIVFAYEALLRSGEELLHSPVAVLRAAERLSRVHEVDRISRDNIARALASSDEQTIVFVNVHGQDLVDPHLLDPRSPMSRFAKQVVLEISERMPLYEISELGARINDLRAIGYRFALDNLGAGHAGVGSLAQIEPEVCKLDASLIRGVDGDSVKQDLVRAMLAVCRDMNILTICQGVETPGERDALVPLGGDLMQGYLFAKPGPAFPSVDFSTLGRTPGSKR